MVFVNRTFKNYLLSQSGWSRLLYQNMGFAYGQILSEFHHNRLYHSPDTPRKPLLRTIVMKSVWAKHYLLINVRSERLLLIIALPGILYTIILYMWMMKMFETHLDVNMYCVQSIINRDEKLHGKIKPFVKY